MEKERWRNILGCNDKYQVSNFGRVKKMKLLYKDGILGEIINLSCDSGGYPKVSINGKLLSVHRLVATYFVKNPDEKPQVNHIDGNKQNNHYSNLEWATASENMQHASNSGLLNYKRLNMTIANEIRLKYKQGISMNKLNKEYNVNNNTIQCIISNKSYNPNSKKYSKD